MNRVNAPTRVKGVGKTICFPVEEGNERSECWKTVVFLSTRRGDKIKVILAFTGDVGRAKCKSTLLHFRAEESEIGGNALRLCAGSVFRPAGETPCGAG